MSLLRNCIDDVFVVVVIVSLHIIIVHCFCMYLHFHETDARFSVTLSLVFYFFVCFMSLCVLYLCLVQFRLVVYLMNVTAKDWKEREKSAKDVSSLNLSGSFLQHWLNEIEIEKNVSDVCVKSSFFASIKVPCTV